MTFTKWNPWQQQITMLSRDACNNDIAGRKTGPLQT